MLVLKLGSGNRPVYHKEIHVASATLDIRCWSSHIEECSLIKCMYVFIIFYDAQTYIVEAFNTESDTKLTLVFKQHAL